MTAALIFFFVGFAIGWLRAAKRGGVLADKIQMGVAHGIPLGIAGLVFSIVAVNLGV